MLKWLEVLKQVGPMVLMFTPLAPIAPAVIAGIHIAEGIGGPGVDKKESVKQIVAIAAEAANVQAGRVVLDPLAAVAAADVAIDTVVSTVNLVHSVNDTEVVPVPPVTP